MSKATGYRKEFFDREYSAREAYGKLWKFARAYRFRIFLGVLCGMLTAGTLVPMFQLIQPTLSKVESVEAPEKKESGDQAQSSNQTEGNASKAVAKESQKLGREYGKLKAFFARFGLEMQGEDEALGLPLLAVIVFVAVFVLPSYV